MPILEHIPLDPRDHLLQEVAKKLIDSGDTVVDIGVNYMQNTRCFLKCVGQSGQVIGVEPNPVLYDKIKKYNIPGGPALQVYKEVLAECERLVTFRQFEDPHSGLSGILETIPSNSLENTIDIKAKYRDFDLITSTLDRLLLNNDIIGKLALIKIDCEGADCEIIRGGSEIIKKYRPPIIMEVCNHTKYSLPSLLTEINYRIYSLESGNVISNLDTGPYELNCILISRDDNQTLDRLGK